MSNHIIPVVFNNRNGNGEEQYQQWLTQHRDGFVLNTTRSQGGRAKYMVLHRAVCRSISEYTNAKTPGCYTQGTYIKICALDIESLKTWATDNGRSDGSFSSEFPRCCRQTDTV